MKDELIQLHRKLAVQQNCLIALEERIKCQEFRMTSNNGVLWWRITNFQQKVQDAISGGQREFSSPDMFTNINGFKMRTIIRLNGKTETFNRNISLYFVILRGEFDCLLEWPFSHIVNFTFKDQAESYDDFMVSFRPDPESICFLKPTAENNPRWGPIEVSIGIQKMRIYL